MQILNVSQNQLIVVNQIQIVLFLKSIKNMNQVVICLYLKGLDGIKDNYKPIVYTKKSEDDNISEKFIKHLKITTHFIYRKYYLNEKPLKLTPEEEKDFKSAKVCHI